MLEIDIKDKICSYQEYIYAICLYAIFYFSQESLVTLTKISYAKGLIISLCITLIYTVLFINKESIYKKKEIIGLSFILLILIILGSFKKGFENTDLYLILVIFMAVTTVIVTPFKIFIKAFINVMIFICISSIIFTYVLRPFIFSGHIMTDVIRNPSDIYFYDCKLAFIVKNITYMRNFGIFREPGVFQIMITLALYLELFLGRKRSYIKIIILYITMLTTFSMPGILQATLLITIFIYTYIREIDDIKKKNKLIISSICFSFVILFCIVFFATLNKNIYSFIQEAVSKLFDPSLALNNRFDAIIYNLDVGFHNLLLGNGFLTVASFDGFNTSTTTAIFAIHGVIFLAFQIISLFVLAKMANKSCFITLLLFIILLITLNTQLIYLSVLIWMIEFYAIDKIGLYRKDRDCYENISISA